MPAAEFPTCRRVMFAHAGSLTSLGRGAWDAHGPPAAAPGPPSSRPTRDKVVCRTSSPPPAPRPCRSSSRSADAKFSARPPCFTAASTTSLSLHVLLNSADAYNVHTAVHRRHTGPPPSPPAAPRPGRPTSRPTRRALQRVAILRHRRQHHVSVVLHLRRRVLQCAAILLHRRQHERYVYVRPQLCRDGRVHLFATDVRSELARRNVDPRH